MIRFETNVRIGIFSEELGKILRFASVWSERYKIDVVVNSWSDGKHSPTSLHPYDLAVDLDTEGDRPADLKRLHTYLARWAGPQYDVLLESDHIHVEWDSRRQAG